MNDNRFPCGAGFRTSAAAPGFEQESLNNVS